MAIEIGLMPFRVSATSEVPAIMDQVSCDNERRLERERTRDMASFWDFGWLYKPAASKVKKLGEESDSAKQQRADMNAQGQAAGAFATEGQDNFRGLGAESYDLREALRRRASGQDSLSAEQLRQGLQQNLAAQRSMAASASPGNAAMAARTAAMNAGRLGAGMSGQASIAGIAERQSAEKALADVLMQTRQQELNAALGSRQNANAAFGAYRPEPSDLEKYKPFIDATVSGLGVLAASDRRLKTDVRPGGTEAERVLDGLKAHVYRYKDPSHGTGRQLGVMAQDLERAGLRQAVADTPAGKMIDGAKLSGANTAMIAALADRMSKLERRDGSKR